MSNGKDLIEASQTNTKSRLLFANSPSTSVEQSAKNDNGSSFYAIETILILKIRAVTTQAPFGNENIYFLPPRDKHLVLQINDVLIWKSWNREDVWGDLTKEAVL